MGAIFEFTAGQGFNKDDLRTETTALGNVITFLAHDSQIEQLFAYQNNKHIAIRVMDYGDMANVRVSWLSVSRLWIDKISILPHIPDYYFILSEAVYDSLKAKARGSNTIAFRLGKNENRPITAHLVMGSYTDFIGGGGGGLLHGAKVPSP